VEGAGYFNQASDMMRVNDLIITGLDTGNTPSVVFYIVTDIDGHGIVTVTAFTA
jgi:hypothetical protein